MGRREAWNFLQTLKANPLKTHQVLERNLLQPLLQVALKTLILVSHLKTPPLEKVAPNKLQSKDHKPPTAANKFGDDEHKYEDGLKLSTPERVARIEWYDNFGSVLFQKGDRGDESLHDRPDDI